MAPVAEALAAVRRLLTDGEPKVVLAAAKVILRNIDRLDQLTVSEKGRHDFVSEVDVQYQTPNDLRMDALLFDTWRKTRKS